MIRLNSVAYHYRSAEAIVIKSSTIRQASNSMQRYDWMCTCRMFVFSFAN